MPGAGLSQGNVSRWAVRSARIPRTLGGGVGQLIDDADEIFCAMFKAKEFPSFISINDRLGTMRGA